jgi:hypothetical protein
MTKHSIFANRITDTLTIPGTDGQTVTIRKLAPKHLEAASDALSLKSMAQIDKFGGLERVTAMQQLGAKGKADVDETQRVEMPADPLRGFDALTLIEKGVVSWTCEEPVGIEAFEELNEDTCDWLAKAILKLARPALFQTADEREDSTVKG